MTRVPPIWKSSSERRAMRSIKLSCLCALVFVSVLARPGVAQAQAGGHDKVDTKKLLTALDERLTSPGDLKWLAYWADFEKGQKKPKATVEAVVYRRDKDDALTILLLGPKTRSGEGYLRLADNLFLYAPTTGKWSRVTLRERLADSEMRTLDIDSTHFARDFTATAAKTEKLGAHKAHHLELRARDGVNVAYSRVDLWIDTETGDLLKRVDMSDDEKLIIRTVYFRGWSDHRGGKEGGKVRLPGEIHFLDNLNGNRTSFFSKKVSLEPLEVNQFTKAWLESKSR